MKKKKSIYVILTICISIIVIFGLFVLRQPTVQYAIAADANFNLIFRYGVGAKNELNTSKGTYTKDMVTDPSITTNLSLPKEDLDIIYQKMLEINFFDYTDKFSVQAPLGESICEQTPANSYYFKVEYDYKIKELSWDDSICNKDAKADKLRELSSLIINIAESKEEYKKLPSPRGGYL